MLQLNLKSGVPICDQIVNGVIRLKALGLMQGGEQLPSVRELAIKLSVNPNTVQKAYRMLESSGIIYSVKGKGSFISDEASAEAAILNNAASDFSAAVKAARELGLTMERLVEIIEQNYGAKGVDSDD